ncbi:PEPxxWA-CTERM sorting domain-containing protein [Methylobacillus sp. Pita2]|uniref:PEPxxWA-CTERM sorting domain-containing protein n=1 Tax=unclassified Methylobacillus TaxID=2647660 RepID=UPI0038B59930
MNIKMKALVAAAVAAMSVSGAANAALQTSASGNSSLVLTVIDKVDGKSATFDLGFSYSDFAVGAAGSSASFSWDLNSGNYADAWNALVGANDLVWGVLAADNVGSINEAGSMGFITTVRDGQVLPTNLRMAQFSTPMAQFDNYLNGNNRLGNHGTVENGASVAELQDGNAYGGNYYSQDKLKGFGPLAVSAVGVEQDVVQYFSAVGALGSLTYVQYDATFKLDANGLLTYTVAAVPEPETYALLLAGLGLVGAAARRRKSA